MASRFPPRRYMELLTPVLHRSFVRAAGVILGVCYMESILLGGSISWFWSWFPLGPAGIRALLLFISALVVFLLRFEQRHIGARNFKSPADSFLHLARSPQILQTFLCYSFSAWWFSEVYFWSASKEANLGWIAAGKSWERRRLNERPIYLRCVFLGLAAFQTAIHTYEDNSRFPIPQIRNEDNKSSTQPVSRSSTTIRALIEHGPTVLRKALLQAFCVAISGPLIYSIFLRRHAWDTSFRIASTIWNIPATGDLSYVPPYHVTLIARSFLASSLLLGLWQSSNLIFSTFLKQAPIKNGLPLTDGSSDPNGSLLKGLAGKKDLPVNFAFLELVCIGQDFPERRKSIFSDIDRLGGATWTQIMNLCLSKVQAISTRISDSQRVPQQLPDAQQPAVHPSTSTNITPPLRQDSILNAPSPPSNKREKAISAFGTFAKSVGESPQSQSQSQSAKRYLEAARSKLLTDNQQKTLSIENVKSEANPYITSLLKSPLCWPFRQTLDRRINTVVFDAPCDDVEYILNAINALSLLAVASLREDSYGKVAQDVPLITRVFMGTLDAIDGFIEGMQAHWTDVIGSKDTHSKELIALRQQLRVGIRRLLDSFETYATELGLNVGEIQAAKSSAQVSADQG